MDKRIKEFVISINGLLSISLQLKIYPCLILALITKSLIGLLYKAHNKLGSVAI